MTVREISRLYTLMAEMLSYPQPGLQTKVRESMEILTAENMPGAAAELEKFHAYCGDHPLGELEEIYSSTFDLNPLCSPYVGYYLFGDNHKRSEFLVRLKKDFGAFDFTVEGEMPDHIAVMLRFLALLEDEYPNHSFIRECLEPALGEMEKKAKDGNPYSNVIRALSLIFTEELKNDAVGGS